MTLREADTNYHDRILKYQKLDYDVVNLLGAEDYQFYIDNTHKAALEHRDDHIKRLEAEILSRNMSIKALQMENKLIWESSISRIAEEKMKVREIEQRWSNSLVKDE